MEGRQIQRLKVGIRPAAFSLFFAIVFFILGFLGPVQVSQGNPDDHDPSTGGKKITTLFPLNELESPDKRDGVKAREAPGQDIYGKLPLSFVQNEGQVDKQVKFYEKGSGRTTFFTKGGVYLSLNKGQSAPSSTKPQPSLIKLTPLGGNKHPKIIAEGLQEGKVNYFIGNDPKKWKTNIPTYQAVVYQEVYPGIDLKFYGNNQQMEYDIIVKPQADPSKVKFAYEGIKDLRVTDEGNLDIRLKEGTILQKKPIVYQEIDGKHVELDGKFIILERKNHSKRVYFPISNAIGYGYDKDQIVTFAYAIEVAQYDKNHPLIIDPVLVYSTYLGGNAEDDALNIALDDSGNAYVTGATSSINFPTANPFQPAITSEQNVFVTKLNASGSGLVYSTYLGGSGHDIGIGIAVDASGNAYVTGHTDSTDFPTANPFQAANAGGYFVRDAFVTKLNTTGSALVYSTYLGGTGTDEGRGIAVDASGNIYLTGNTTSTNFPAVNPFQATNHGSGFYYNAFVTKLNPAGSALVYSTYLGGSNGDTANGIALDSLGNTYVTGYTLSTNFPITPGAFQQTIHTGGLEAYVIKLNSAGSALVYSTYLGGSGDEVANGIVVDASGNAYVTGQTSSTNFPIANPFQSTYGGGALDAFVTKVNSTGTALVYSTYLGGGNGDGGRGIAVDSLGEVYVTGDTGSTNFPTTNPFQAALAGNTNAFVTKLDSAGSGLVYSSYLGGSPNEFGGSIAVDISGNAYVTGSTDSASFPITPGAFQTAYGGGEFDAFVVKIGQETTTTTTTTTTTSTTTTTVRSTLPDVGIKQIDAPGKINTGKSKTVKVKVRNYSNTTQTRNVSLFLNGVNTGIGQLVTLKGGKETNVEFDVYFGTPGIATLEASLFPGDSNPGNDGKIITVQVKDKGKDKSKDKGK